MKRFRKIISFVERLEPLLDSLAENASSDVFFEFSQGLKKVVIDSAEGKYFPLERSFEGINQDSTLGKREFLESSFCRVLREQDARVEQLRKKHAVSFFLRHQYSQLLSVTETKTVLDYLALVLFGLARGINYGYSSTSLSFFTSPDNEVTVYPDEVYFVATHCLLKNGLVKDTSASAVFSAVKASFVLGAFYQLFSPFLDTSSCWFSSRTADTKVVFSPSEWLLCGLSWEAPTMSALETQFVDNSLRALAGSSICEPLEAINVFCLNLDPRFSSSQLASFNLFLDKCFTSWNVPIHQVETIEELEPFTGPIDEEFLSSLSSADGLILRDLFVLGEYFALPILRALWLPF